MPDELTTRLAAWGRQETFGALELGAIDPPPRLIAAVARARRRRAALRAAIAVAALSLVAWSGWEAMRSGVIPAPPQQQLAERQAVPETPAIIADDADSPLPAVISRSKTPASLAPAPLILPWPMAKPATPLPAMPPVTTRREPPPP